MATRGIALFAGTPPEIIEASAALAEELGFGSFWVNHPGSHDGVAALALAAQATSRIDLGVGVVPLNLRDAASVVATARSNDLPTARLLLGIGAADTGAFRRIRDGAQLLREELECRVVMGALSEPACRLAGAIADGVLFNWLTPDHARKSVDWVTAGADRAGRPRPHIYAYVRLALGDQAQQTIEREAVPYLGGRYGPRFQAMGATPLETSIAASEAADVNPGITPWDGVVDTVVLRPVFASPMKDAYLDLVRAAAPSG